MKYKIIHVTTSVAGPSRMREPPNFGEMEALTYSIDGLLFMPSHVVSDGILLNPMDQLRLGRAQSDG
jgi:hypothetical protein